MARRAGVPVIVGNIDAYEWRRRVIVLRSITAEGTDETALFTAAHEAAHADQQRDWPWIRWWLRYLEPFRLWLELDANRRARKTLTALKKD